MVGWLIIMIFFLFKGRCNREKPPCKYFHPPLHLKEQLLINGRNHLALKNALMQQIGIAPGHAMLPGQVSAVVSYRNARTCTIQYKILSPRDIEGKLISCNWYIGTVLVVEKISILPLILKNFRLFWKDLKIQEIYHSQFVFVLFYLKNKNFFT